MNYFFFSENEKFFQFVISSIVLKQVKQWLLLLLNLQIFLQGEISVISLLYKIILHSFLNHKFNDNIIT